MILQVLYLCSFATNSNNKCLECLSTIHVCKKKNIWSLFESKSRQMQRCERAHSTNRCATFVKTRLSIKLTESFNSKGLRSSLIHKSSLPIMLWQKHSKKYGGGLFFFLYLPHTFPIPHSRAGAASYSSPGVAAGAPLVGATKVVFFTASLNSWWFGKTIVWK